MNATQLFRRSSRTTHRFRATGVWFCSKCKVVYRDAKAANACCNYRCEDCREPTKNFILVCRSCQKLRFEKRRKDRIAKAFKHTVMSVPADAPIFCERTERFYPDIDTAMEALEEDFEEYPDQQVVLWICDKETPSIDPDDVVGERLHEALELSEDSEVESICEGIDELRAAVEAFNKKQTPTLWRDHGKACVILTKADYQEPAKPEAPSP